jgi:hypothetical protein
LLPMVGNPLGRAVVLVVRRPLFPRKAKNPTRSDNNAVH